MLKTLYDRASDEVRVAFDIQPDYRFTIRGALFEGRRAG
jgi:hypothetical protein